MQMMNTLLILSAVVITGQWGWDNLSGQQIPPSTPVVSPKLPAGARWWELKDSKGYIHKDPSYDRLIATVRDMNGAYLATEAPVQPVVSLPTQVQTVSLPVVQTQPVAPPVQPQVQYVQNPYRYQQNTTVQYQQAQPRACQGASLQSLRSFPQTYYSAPQR